MKNRKFFYQQYDKIDWENQDKIKLNYKVYDYIINNIITKYNSLSLFDMGFGVGYLFYVLQKRLSNKNIYLSGCEPSIKNFNYFKSKDYKNIKVYNKDFINLKINEKFNIITSIYVFPHFLSRDLIKIVKNIYRMLNCKGIFVLVVANGEYLSNKLKIQKDLFIEENRIKYNNKKYKELLYYSYIPTIGKIIDYYRYERYYINLFKNNKFKLINNKKINDSGFICDVLVFEKI